MNFAELIKPYEDGGTQSKPVKRTLEGIIDWLLNKKQYPMEIVGGAVFIVFNWITTGGSFKGDGSYGSKGRELDTAIRIKCDELLRIRQTAATHEVFVAFYARHLRKYIIPTWKRRFLTWWHGRDLFK